MILKAEAVLAELRLWMNAYQDKMAKMYGEAKVLRGETGNIPPVIQIRMKTVLNELTMLVLEKWTKGAQAQLKGGSHEEEPGLSRSAPSTPELTKEELQNQYLRTIETVRLNLQDRHFQILMPILEEDLAAKRQMGLALDRVGNILYEQLPRLTTQVKESLEAVKKVINLLD